VNKEFKMKQREMMVACFEVGADFLGICLDELSKKTKRSLS